MTRSRRAEVTSSFTIVKGAMLDETYAVLSAWDLSRGKRENLDHLRAANFIGARSATWLRDVAKVINRRFDPGGRDRPLVELARAGCDPAIFRPLVLFHITRDEFLLRDFLLHFLYPAFEAGAYRVKLEDVLEHLDTIARRGAVMEHAWAPSTKRRVAAGLLKMAVDFGLLRGSVVKVFASYHLPDASFLYLLHALRDEKQGARKVIDAPDWRLFLMSSADVERELLRLHQYRRLDYQVAGSLVDLRLPSASAPEYARTIV